MSQPVALRSGKDRLRYTILFEISLMSLLIPAGAIFFDKGLGEIGLLGLVLMLKAMLLGRAHLGDDIATDLHVVARPLIGRSVGHRPDRHKLRGRLHVPLYAGL